MEPQDIGAILIFFLVVTIEMIIGAVRHIKLYKGKDTRNNIILGIATSLVKAFVMYVPVLAFFSMFYDNGWVLFPKISQYWWSWVLLLIALDFLFYWFHRLSHISRIFWASHVVHHNSQFFNFTTSIRGIFVIMFYRFLFFTPLALIGFDALHIILMDRIVFFYQLFIHTKTIKSWGVFEWFLNTPSHHRVHHASNAQYIDKNYAAVFIIWDRMFGTFEPEVEEPVYGLITNLETDNIFIVGFHEFIAIFKDLFKAKSFSDGAHLLFDHPGWKISHQSHKEFLASLQKKD
jgi:sterol desaturase/sphingolipid hydroxylase (fatty acid hydroxylase superfamily)